MDALLAAAPPGLEIISVESVESSEPSLQSNVAAIEYNVIPLNEREAFITKEGVASLLDQAEIIRSRRGKSYDLRPLILELEIVPVTVPILRMSLSAGEGKTGRPEEVLLALGVDPAETLITRTHLSFEN
jgi:hypothetical protein